MRRLTVAAALFGFAACATSGPNELGSTTERVSVSEGGAQVMEVSISRDDPALTRHFDASPEAIWRLLPAVYADVGLPAPALDEESLTVAVQDHVMMRRIGDERMSRLIDCGRDMSGDHADSHRIRLNVRTWVTGAAPATDVHTRVEATATSVEGRPGSITCTTRGRLEQNIAEALRTRLPAG
jgi:hypothetical protein